MANLFSSRIATLFFLFAICLTSFNQSVNIRKSTLDSLLSYKWPVTVSNEEGTKPSDKKILPFDASPAELPDTIEFFSNGTILVNLKKGAWRINAKKDIIRIVLGAGQTLIVSITCKIKK